jgi:hypothetical protein
MLSPPWRLLLSHSLSLHYRRRPLIDLHYPHFPIRVTPIAAPLPVFRLQHQSALHGIPMESGTLKPAPSRVGQLPAKLVFTRSGWAYHLQQSRTGTIRWFHPAPGIGVVE